MNIPALAGYTVGITADRRWEEQAELFARKGARVLHGPTIRTLPLGPESELRDASERLIADPPDAVVLTTGVGMRGWGAAAESLGIADDLLSRLRQARIFARGAKAAGAATTAGLSVAWRAPNERTDAIVEQLSKELATGELVLRPGHSVPRVAFQLDGAAESSSVERLVDLGFDVVAVRVYRWTHPVETSAALRLVHGVADRSIDALTFTAAPAVRGFFELVDKVGRRDAVLSAVNSGAVIVACIGPVCAEAASMHGVESSIEPASARLGVMVHACAAALAERRRSLRLGGYDVVVQGKLISVNGDEPDSLSDRERGVLDVLAEKPGVVYSKAALLRTVWGPSEKDDHVVEVTVGRLRRRLGPAGAGVETVVRRGYRLAESA